MKKRWKRVLLSLLPLLLVFAALCWCFGLFSVPSRELPDSVSPFLQLETEEEQIPLCFTQFSLSREEGLDPIRQQLSDTLANADDPDSPLYRLAVPPGASIRLYSSSDAEDPYQLSLQTQQGQLPLNEEGVATLPDEEGTYHLTCQKNYSDVVLVDFTIEVVVSEDEVTRDRINVDRYIEEIREIDPYNMANVEGYQINRALIRQKESIIMGMGESGLNACVSLLSDGQTPLLSDYVLCRWIAELSGIGEDLDSWATPDDYRERYLQEVIDSYEIDMAAVQ